MFFISWKYILSSQLLQKKSIYFLSNFVICASISYFCSKYTCWDTTPSFYLLLFGTFFQSRFSSFFNPIKFTLKLNFEGDSSGTTSRSRDTCSLVLTGSQFREPSSQFDIRYSKFKSELHS